MGETGRPWTEGDEQKIPGTSSSSSWVFYGLTTLGEARKKRQQEKGGGRVRVVNGGRGRGGAGGRGGGGGYSAASGW